jgi:thioredoxin 1
MTTASFDNIIHQGHLHLVDFYAQWCGACHDMELTLQRIALSLGDKVDIIKINTDMVEHRRLVRRYNIVAVPTFILFSRGEAIWRDSGIVRYEHLASAIHRYSHNR